MCRSHASYVLKERPNIYVPPVAPDIFEYQQQATYTERALNLWWDEQRVTQKLKVGTLIASYKGDFVYFLSVDKKNETVSFNNLQPDLFVYDRVSQDPYSPYRWVMRADLLHYEDLRLRFPAFKDVINPSGVNSRFLSYTNFYRSDLYSLEKAVFVELMDEKYLYTYINDIEISVVEHGYDFIPFYHFKYFDTGSKYGMSLMEFIRDPIKFMNQLIGYQHDLALKVSNPPLIITGGNADISADNLKGGKITLPSMGTVQYLAPPMSQMGIDKMVESMRTYMHFLSGINEEAMAGFSGALTSAGVAIELRMDATVREAIDVQINLQDIIQRINRDYLKLMEKFFPKKDLFNSKEFGKISDIEFPAKLIGGYYKNIVDFGGVLPRSDSDTVRNVLAKVNAGMISKHTALEEMRYMDPGIELNKIRMQMMDETRLKSDLESGNQPEKKFFDSPKQEETYMFETGKLAIPHPVQNHEEHLKSHEAKYQTNPFPQLLQHIMMTKNLMRSSEAISKMPVRQMGEAGQGYNEQAP